MKCDGCSLEIDGPVFVYEPRGYSHHSFCDVVCWQAWMEEGLPGQYAIPAMSAGAKPTEPTESLWTRFWRAVVRAMWGN